MAGVEMREIGQWLGGDGGDMEEKEVHDGCGN
jgi:hypothetical protein